MAVAVANSTAGYYLSDLNFDNWNGLSVTRSTGEGLFIGVWWYLNSGTPTVTWDPTGDNQTLTQIGTTVVGSGDGNNRAALFYLAAPTSAKTANVKFQWGSNFYNVGAACALITGHDTSDMIRSGSFASNSAAFPDGSTPVTATSSSATGDLCIDFAAYRGSPINVAPYTGQTQIVDYDTGTVFNQGMSSKAGGASVTMGWTNIDGASYWMTELIASVKASAGGGDVSTSLTGQGVTGSAGTVTPSRTIAVSGQAVTASAGTLTAAQLAVPTTDSTAGAWVASDAGSLYAAIDEIERSDSDYIYVGGNSTCKLKLASLVDPVSSSNHVVKYACSVASGKTLTVSLVQGASTVISSWNHPGAVTLQTFTQTLSGAEADSITDYTDLYLWFATS